MKKLRNKENINRKAAKIVLKKILMWVFLIVFGYYMFLWVFTLGFYYLLSFPGIVGKILFGLPWVCIVIGVLDGIREWIVEEYKWAKIELYRKIEQSEKDKPVRINEGQEKGNTKTVNTQRPNVQPAPQKPAKT